MLLQVASWLPEALAAGKDEVVLKTGRGVPGLTVLSETYESVEVDRDGDGKADEPFPAEKVANVKYGDAPVAFRRAEISLKQGRYAEAAEMFQKALGEKNVRAFWLKQHANYLIGECLRRQGENDAALLPTARKAYERVISEMPKGRLVPQAIRGAGLCLLREGRTDDARSWFEKLKEDYKFGEAWALRGMLLLAHANSLAGSHDEALVLCKEVLDDSGLPKYEDLRKDALLTRAALLIAAGKYKEGHEAFTKIARTAAERDVETKAQAYNGIGDGLLGVNRVKEALLAYLRVRVLYFKAQEELPHALYGAARCFTVLRKANEARELVTRLQKEYPKSAWTAKAKKELGG